MLCETVLGETVLGETVLGKKPAEFEMLKRTKHQKSTQNWSQRAQNKNVQTKFTTTISKREVVEHLIFWP